MTDGPAGDAPGHLVQQNRVRELIEAGAPVFGALSPEGERWAYQILDALPAAVYITDTAGHIQYCNRAATDVVGIIKESRTAGTEISAERPDGTRVPLRAHSIALHDASGALAGRVTMLVDIAERERTTVQQHHILSIAEHSDDAIVSKDLNGIVTSWNGGAEWLLGYKAEEIIGRSIAILMQPDQRTEEPRIIARIQRGEHVPRHEAVLVHKDGHTIPVSVTISPVKDARGRIIGVSRIVRDITERKRAERTLRRSDESLRRLNEDLENRVQEEVAARQRAQARLRQVERMEALTQLAGGIAHDFNNVLQTIASGVRLLRQQPDEPETIDEIMSAMSEAAERGASVTRRLLAFARRAELLTERVNVGRLLGSLHKVLARQLGDGITISIDAAPELTLTADAAQLEATLINLAMNARDAMPRGGTLRFTAAIEKVKKGSTSSAPPTPGTYVRLAVSDDGQGMDPATLVHASEPFFTTKPAGKGTGLGLAGARGFAEQSGGSVAIESTLGRGTTVTLWFPAVSDSVLPMNDESKAKPAAPEAPKSRLLLVGDDRATRETLARELENQRYNVIPAASVAAAHRLIKAGEVFNLAVIVLSEPRMDSIALIQEAQERQPRLPTILISGFAATTAEVVLTSVRTSVHAAMQAHASAAALTERTSPQYERDPRYDERRTA